MVLFSDAAILLQWYNKYKLMGPIRKANINIKLNAASNIRVQKKRNWKEKQRHRIKAENAIRKEETEC